MTPVTDKAERNVVCIILALVNCSQSKHHVGEANSFHLVVQQQAHTVPRRCKDTLGIVLILKSIYSFNLPTHTLCKMTALVLLQY